MKESHVYWSKNRHNKPTINTYFKHKVKGGTGYTTLSPCTFEQWHFSSYSNTNKMCLFLKLFILVKHYKFRTVFPSIIRSSRMHIQQQAYVKQLLQVAAAVTYLLLYMQSWAPDDGRKDHPKHVECFTRINNLRNRCILLVLL